MNLINRIADWLETRWVTPAYAGWLLGAVAICFFGAATNTMAGWLYVISGISFALLGLAAILPARSLRHLEVRRHSIEPVSVGDELTIELELKNQTNHPKTLLQVQDVLPYVLGKPIQTPVETIPPQGAYRWTYYYPTQHRGVYRWHAVQIRTGTPLGLFWCRRIWNAPATAIVYPTVLPLAACPLIDEMGQEDSPQFYSNRRYQTATEGVTRSLRPYRLGDPTRLIHWRTSARYGDLQVRELEVVTGGQEIVICLDSATAWPQESFEQAVIAAASLYFYACRCQLNVKLWTAGTGVLHGDRVILEALAAIGDREDAYSNQPPTLPLIWLTPNPNSISTLPNGSRWVLWPPESTTTSLSLMSRNFPGLTIQPDEPLQPQLQESLR